MDTLYIMQSAKHPGMGSAFFAERPRFMEGLSKLESNCDE